MMYEIRTYEKFTVGSTYKKSYLTDAFSFTETKKGKVVKFIANGKKSTTYVRIATDAFISEFETVIAEATTGRVLYRFN